MPVVNFAHLFNRSFQWSAYGLPGTVLGTEHRGEQGRGSVLSEGFHLGKETCMHQITSK